MPRRVPVGILAIVLVATAATIAVGTTGPVGAMPRDLDADGISVGASGSAPAVRGQRTQEAPDPSVAAAVPFDVGRSVGGRMITGFHRRGSDAATRTVLVVGVIHGDELGGLSVTQLLSTIALPPDLDLWVVPVMDVDGVATGRHGNGAGVDLNRNWPVDWVAPGVVDETSGVKNSGPAPGSEPETKEMMALIQTIRPTVTVWYHEPFDTVDCNVVRVGPVCSQFAASIGYSVTLRERPGTATDWIMTTGHGVSFVVELPDGGVDPATAAVQAAALLQLR